MIELVKKFDIIHYDHPLLVVKVNYMSSETGNHKTETWRET